MRCDFYFYFNFLLTLAIDRGGGGYYIVVFCGMFLLVISRHDTLHVSSIHSFPLIKGSTFMNFANEPTGRSAVQILGTHY